MDYASRGWPVFPLRPRDKAPITLNGYLSASTDPDYIEAWWTNCPDANIGVACGVGFDVLDVDGPQGRSSIETLLSAEGIEPYSHTGPATSTSRGNHLFFAPSGRQGRSGILDKVDFQAKGKYIVAPPSIHPDGPRYEWLTSPDLQLEPVPAWVLQLLDERETQPPTPPTEARIPSALSANRPPILEVATRLNLRLSRAGRGNWKTNCIYHNDPEPSLVLYVSEDRWYCFGCAKSGDSHDLLAGTYVGSGSR